MRHSPPALLSVLPVGPLGHSPMSAMCLSPVTNAVSLCRPPSPTAQALPELTQVTHACNLHGRAGVLGMHSLRFPSLETVFMSPPLENVFARGRLLHGWVLFPFQHFSSVAPLPSALRGLLIVTASPSRGSLIAAFPSSFAPQRLSKSSAYNSLALMCLPLDFLVFLLLATFLTS